MDWEPAILPIIAVLAILLRVFTRVSSGDESPAEIGLALGEDSPTPKRRADSDRTEAEQTEDKSAEATGPVDADTTSSSLPWRLEPMPEEALRALGPLTEKAARAAYAVLRDVNRFQDAGGELGLTTQALLLHAVKRLEKALDADEAVSAGNADMEGQTEALARKASAAAARAAWSLENDRKRAPEATIEERALEAEDQALVKKRIAKAAKREWKVAKNTVAGSGTPDPAALVAKEAAKKAKETAKAAQREAEAQRRRADIQRARVAANVSVERRGIGFGGVVVAIVIALLFVFVVLPLGGLAACGAILADLVNG